MGSKNSQKPRTPHHTTLSSSSLTFPPHGNQAAGSPCKTPLRFSWHPVRLPKPAHIAVLAPAEQKAARHGTVASLADGRSYTFSSLEVRGGEHDVGSSPFHSSGSPPPTKKTKAASTASEPNKAEQSKQPGPFGHAHDMAHDPPSSLLKAPEGHAQIPCQALGLPSCMSSHTQSHSRKERIGHSFQPPICQDPRHLVTCTQPGAPPGIGRHARQTPAPNRF